MSARIHTVLTKADEVTARLDKVFALVYRHTAGFTVHDLSAAAKRMIATAEVTAAVRTVTVFTFRALKVAAGEQGVLSAFAGVVSAIKL